MNGFYPSLKITKSCICKEEMTMGKNKLDPINFCKIFDMLGEEAAKDTLNDVNTSLHIDKFL